MIFSKDFSEHAIDVCRDLDKNETCDNRSSVFLIYYIGHPSLKRENKDERLNFLI